MKEKASCCMKKPIKLIIFDLWGTLAYHDVSYDVLAKMHEKSASGVSLAKFREAYKDVIESREWESEIESYEALCKEVGSNPEENALPLMLIRHDANKNIRLFSHAIPMMKGLKERGRKVGIVSNSDRFSNEILKRETDLLVYPDYMVFSFEVNFVKPDVRIFEKMLEMSGFESGEAVMIGDSLEGDIIPAQKIGIEAIQYTSYDKLKEKLEEILSQSSRGVLPCMHGNQR